MPDSTNPPPLKDVTALLHAWRDGSGAAFAALIDEVYDELKRIAAVRLNQVGRASTLSPTELLHDALVGLMPANMAFNDRSHFFATVSLAIRSVLVDHARARAAQKRGGDLERVTLTGIEGGEGASAFDLLAIDEALTRLEQEDPRAGQVMHLAYFGGLAPLEIAELLGVSESTVVRDLRFARVSLLKTLNEGE
jgi:RNA polymerase sigma factor (TIGR02999 family)